MLTMLSTTRSVDVTSVGTFSRTCRVVDVLAHLRDDLTIPPTATKTFRRENNQTKTFSMLLTN
jgi:hypothetical protein